MFRLSKNRITPTNLFDAMVVPIILLLLMTGCGTTHSTADSSTPLSTSENEVSRESYTRILQQGQIVGYIGMKSATVIRGGSEITINLYNIYDQGFEILGSYNEMGSTYRFTDSGPKKLGNFSTEQSFRQVTGIDGILEYKEGLQ